MGLSYEERQALRARAAGLREEVSSLRSEQDEAVASLSQDMEDAALVREVQELEKQRDDAAASRDRATVTAATAAELMEAAAQSEIVRDAVAATEPSASSTDASVDSDTVDPANQVDETDEQELNTTLTSGERE